MRKPSTSSYRTTNWSSYNAALRGGGLLLIWVDKDMTWRAPQEGRPGRPTDYSDTAIQFCLSIKVMFKLPSRQTERMVASLLRLAGLDWPVPDFFTLCRRQKTLSVRIPYRRAGGPLNLLVDSTRFKFLGDGEWQARKHEVQGRRQRRKVHLAMDTATSDIRAAEFTPSGDRVSPVQPDLLGQIPEAEQRATRHYGRVFWKRWTGYHVRSQIEAKMRSLKAFGEHIMARDPDRQTAEIHIRIALMNRLNALGTAETVRVA